MKKKEKLQTKEFYKSKILGLENDVNKIFDKLTSEKNISSYQLEILYNKLENLNITIANNLTNFVEADNLIVSKMKKYLKVFYTFTTITIGTIFISKVLALICSAIWLFL